MKPIKQTFLAIAVLVCSGVASATPLTMNYIKQSVGAGQYQYDFQLVLDNHDATWTAGQQWDWIVFGDRPGPSLPEGIPNSSWHWLTSDPIISRTSSGGGHQGPTLAISGSVLLPGWTPTSLGDFLSWSGTTSANLANGNLYWSPVITSGGVASNFYERAHEVASFGSSAVPEPGSLFLIGLGLIGVAAGRRRKA